MYLSHVSAGIVISIIATTYLVTKSKCAPEEGGDTCLAIPARRA